MIPDERAAIERLKAEAHDLARQPDGSVPSSLAAAEYVRLLREVEGIAPAAIADHLDRLARSGAAKVLADWRRKHRAPARTARGTAVDAPRYAGTTRPDGDGEPQRVQVELPGMTIDELRGHHDRLRRTRDTLSIEVRLAADLIEVMEAEGYATAGQAIEHLMRAS